MEQTVVDRLCQRSDYITNSKTSRLRTKPRSIEPGSATDMEGRGNCGHFSIRRYVAETRKRDWQVTWPFSLPDDHTELDEPASLLPPLNVAEFRWWHCPNCLQKIDAADVDKNSGEVMNHLGDNLKADFTCSCENGIVSTNDDATMFLSGFQQVCEDIEGRKVNEDSNTGISLNAVESYSLFCSDTKEKEASLLYKDGIAVAIGQSHGGASHGPTKESGMLDSSLILSTDKRLSDLVLCEKPISHENNVSEAVTVKSRENDLVESYKECNTRDEAPIVSNTEVLTSMTNKNSDFCHRDDGEGPSNRMYLVEMKEQNRRVIEDGGLSHELDTNVQDDDPLNDTEVLGSGHNCMGLYESDRDFSQNNEDLTRSESSDQHIAGKLDTSNGVLRQKKAQKTRLLSDIIKSEVAGVSEKILIFNRDAEINCIHTAPNHSKAASESSKEQDLQGSNKSNVAVQDDNKKHVVGNKRSKKPQAERKGSSLMSWLKNVTGKTKIHKRFGEAKHIIPTPVNSKSVPDASPEAGEHPCQSDVAAERCDRKTIVGKKRTKNTQVENGLSPVTAFREPINGKARNSAGKAETKHVDTEIIQSKSALDSPLGLGLHPGRMHRKETLAKKKTKMPRVNDGMSTPKHWLKDSIATSNGDTITDFEGPQKATQKHAMGNSKACEQDSLDDIPMEIVELMAKHQHERRLLNAEDATKNLSEIPEPTSSLNAPNAMVYTVACRDASGFCHDEIPVQKPWLNSAGSTICTTTKKFLEAYGTKQTDNQESACGRANYDGQLILAKRMSFDINMPPDVDDSYDEIGVDHRLDLLSKQNKSEDAHGNCGLNPKRSDLAHHHKKQKGSVVSEANREILPLHTFSCVDSGNEYYSTMGQLDLCTNEAISAMNLLRLMDCGACSSTPTDVSVAGKQANPLMKPQFSKIHHHRDFFCVEDAVFGSRNSSMHPMSFDFFDRKHKMGNPYELFSLLPKNGAFGSSLHDIAADSGKSRSHLGFLSGLSDNSSSPRNCGNGTKKRAQTGGPRSYGYDAQEGLLCNKKKRLLSSSDSIEQFKNHEMALSVNYCPRDVKNCYVPEICTINRNPAEFTIPEAGNEYMIESEDRRFMIVSPSGDKPLRVMANVDGHKRRRMKKLTALQER